MVSLLNLFHSNTTLVKVKLITDANNGIASEFKYNTC